jgi:hypothetical protein
MILLSCQALRIRYGGPEKKIPDTKTDGTYCS